MVGVISKTFTICTFLLLEYTMIKTFDVCFLRNLKTRVSKVIVGIISLIPINIVSFYGARYVYNLTKGAFTDTTILGIVLDMLAFIVLIGIMFFVCIAIAFIVSFISAMLNFIISLGKAFIIKATIFLIIIFVFIQFIVFK